MSSSA
jgi:hypothetical protein